MEDFTNKKEIKMSGIKILNLNERALMRRRGRLKIHENFHFRKNGIKVVGKADDEQECQGCHKILSLTAFTTKNSRVDGAYYLQNKCRQCSVRVNREKNEARRNAPPKQNHCECCHKNKKLELDHLHGTAIFRGWLCGKCNTGIGMLGDTLEAVLQAAIYLENDKDKIIETLHKVYGEIFGRTIEEQ